MPKERWESTFNVPENQLQETDFLLLPLYGFFPSSWWEQLSIILYFILYLSRLRIW